jgi:hypothetical protein
VAGQRHRRWMNELLVGYGRVSTEQQDLTAQRNGLHALGVSDDRIYVDHGLSGANGDRPGFGWPLLRAEPVTRWASPSWTGSPGRCPTPGTSSTSSRRKRQAQPRRARSTTRPTQWGSCCYNVLAMVAEFEADLIRLRTREGMK